MFYSSVEPPQGSAQLIQFQIELLAANNFRHASQFLKCFDETPLREIFPVDRREGGSKLFLCAEKRKRAATGAIL
jgi:hypothetical protein